MIKKIFIKFASVRLTIFLFFTLAVTSVLGTLVVQGLPADHYEKAYGPGLVSLFDVFDITDMYHSWWFILLMVLLAVNIAACSFRTLPRTLKKVFRKDSEINEAAFRVWPIRYTGESRDPINEVEQHVCAAVRHLAGAPVVKTQEAVRYVYAERGAVTQLGMVFVHISILVILAGGLIGSIGGFIGQMTIVEGDTSGSAVLFPGNREKTLPFSVRCDRFIIEFYDNGMPKEYRSDVTIFDEGKITASESIRVNHPFTYKGFKLCQASYGIAGATDFKIAVRAEKNDVASILTLEPMKKMVLPGGDAHFAIARFTQNHQGQGPSVLGVIIKPEAPHDIFWIPYSAHHPLRTKRGGFVFELQKFTPRYYTGIQIGKDPGMPLVWIGFMLILAGFVMVLFISHRRLWVRITPLRDGCRIDIAARTERVNERSYEKAVQTQFLKMMDVIKVL